MTVDASLLRYYCAVTEAFPVLVPDTDAQAVRQRFSDVAKAYAPNPDERVAIEQIEIPLEGRTLAARLYRPKAEDGPLPLLVYFHSGGWVVGDLNTHDPLVTQLALAARCAVASVDYTLAAGLRHRSPGGGRRQRGRASFGRSGAWREQARCGARQPSTAALSGDAPPVRKPSCLANANGPGLTNEEMKWYWAQFLSGVTPDAHDVRAFPLAEPYERTPAPALIVAASHDPRYDDAYELKRFLESNDGRIELIDAADMTYGFGRMHTQSAAAHA